MRLFLLAWRKTFPPVAYARPFAALAVVLLVPLLLLRAQAQTPTFTSAVPCGAGSTGFGNGLRIAQNVLDAAGNTYVTGYFLNSATFGTISLQSPGDNMFVAKLNPTGTVLWAVRAGNGAYGRSITVDASGNVLVTGAFRGTVAFGAIQLVSVGGYQNAFVAKLNSAGSFLWAVRAGGNAGDSGNGIAVDAAGNSYVCGVYSAASPNIADFGPFMLVETNAGVGDVFVAKIDPSGTFLWATGGGGGSTDVANGIVLDVTGSVYVTGSISGAFGSVAHFGPATVTAYGDEDILVAKLSPAGSFLWATGAGGRTADIGRRLAVDAQGNVHVVGWLMSAQAAFGSITLPHPNQGTFDAFVAQLTPAGIWQWAVAGGGPGDDYGNDLVLDATGNTYAVGGCSYQAPFGNTVLSTTGDQDVFICKIDAAGAYVWAVQGGGSGNDQATGVVLDATGTLVLAGSTLSSLAIFGTQAIAGNPTADTGFLARLTNSGPLAVAPAHSEPELALWPNPARGGEVMYLTGLTTRQPVEVRDVLGRVVLIVPVPVSGAVELTLPAGLASGVYFARTGPQVRRFSIQ
jgi:hypothetical protein